MDDLRESPAAEVVRLLQKEGAIVKVWEPFKPDARLNGIDMAASFENAIEDTDLILLLVRHTEFIKIQPDEIASQTRARVLIDCVNGWDPVLWEDSGFSVYRLGVNNLRITTQQSQI